MDGAVLLDRSELIASQYWFFALEALLVTSPKGSRLTGWRSADPGAGLGPQLPDQCLQYGARPFPQQRMGDRPVLTGQPDLRHAGRALRRDELDGPAGPPSQRKLPAQLRRPRHHRIRNAVGRGQQESQRESVWQTVTARYS